MKRNKNLVFVVVFLFVVLFFVVSLTSCKKKDYAEFEQWAGDWSSIKEIKPDEPILFIWAKPIESPAVWWYQYKRFCETSELVEIKRGITSPEKGEANLNIDGEKLLCFFMGRDLKMGLKAMSFRLDDETKEFVGPNGRDKVLYKLFTEKQPFKNFYGHSDNELQYIEEQQQIISRLSRLFRENGDPNEIRRLKDEYWKTVESRLNSHLKKYPWRADDLDINEIRRKTEEGWENMEQMLNRSKQNTDQNKPAMN